MESSEPPTETERIEWSPSPFHCSITVGLFNKSLYHLAVSSSDSDSWCDGDTPPESNVIQ